jgi:hypothetical protein
MDIITAIYRVNTSTSRNALSTAHVYGKMWFHTLVYVDVLHATLVHTLKDTLKDRRM